MDQAQINTCGVGMGCSTSKYEYDNQVSIHFWPYNVNSARKDVLYTGHKTLLLVFIVKSDLIWILAIINGPLMLTRPPVSL